MISREFLAVCDMCDRKGVKGAVALAVKSRMLELGWKVDRNYFLCSTCVKDGRTLADMLRHIGKQ